MLNISSKQGLSLLEIMIVLAIIVILTITTVPSFINITKSQRLKATAEDLYYTLQFARSEAIRRNATIYFSYTPGDTWCYGINVGSVCNCNIAGNCSILTTQAPKAQQLSLTSTGYAGNSLSFEGTHGAANNSGTFTYSLYGGSSLIRISTGRLGNSQMCSTGISGYAAC